MTKQPLKTPLTEALPFIANVRAKKLADLKLAVFEKWEKDASADSRLASPKMLALLQRSNLRAYSRRERLVEQAIAAKTDLSGSSEAALQASVREATAQSKELLEKKFCLSRLETYLWLSERDKVVRQTLCFLFNKQEIVEIRLSFGRYAPPFEGDFESCYRANKANKALLCEVRPSPSDHFMTSELCQYQSLVERLTEKKIKILDIVIAYPFPERLLSFKENNWL